ncbi:hypothetical protein [Streptomyces sp. gb14]|uniref:hypothetical protein n=1 Tax=Streptomyces sp. gb14 TaxID=1827753 RepID=UPI000BF1E211|nr:hypothetical protein [Streptomyces sp. gb14]
MALAPHPSGAASLWSEAARRRGMEVTVLPVGGVPERYRQREDGHSYGGPRLAARCAGPLGAALLEPYDGWLDALPPAFTGRDVRRVPLSEPPSHRVPRLVPAAERTHWRDVRGALYLRPDAGTDPAADTAPGQADVLLVHGEAASAREAYRSQGEATPGEPHLLAGWLLAHTALHPGLRRLLARPEKFAAAVEGRGPEVWEHAAHRLAAPGASV